MLDLYNNKYDRQTLKDNIYAVKCIFYNIQWLTICLVDFYSVILSYFPGCF